MPQKFNTEESANKYTASQQVQPGEEISTDYFVKKMVYPTPPTYEFGVPGTEGVRYEYDRYPEPKLNGQNSYIAGRLLDPRVQADMIYRIRKKYPEISSEAIQYYLNSLTVDLGANINSGGRYIPFEEKIELKESDPSKIGQGLLAHEVAHAIREDFLKYRYSYPIPYDPKQRSKLMWHRPYDFASRLPTHQGTEEEIKQMKDLYGKYVNVDSYRKKYHSDDDWLNRKDKYGVQESFAEHTQGRTDLQLKMNKFGRDYDKFLPQISDNELERELIKYQFYFYRKYLDNEMQRYASRETQFPSYWITDVRNYERYRNLQDKYTQVSQELDALLKQRHERSAFNPILTWKIRKESRLKEDIAKQLRQTRNDHKTGMSEVNSLLPSIDINQLRDATVSTFKVGGTLKNYFDYFK